MIKVVFDHIEGFGKITEQDFIYSDPKGIAEGRDYIDYLNQGWIEWGDYWYNLRSVRLRVGEYQPTKTVKKLSKQIEYTTHVVTEFILDYLGPIYEKYVTKHGFERNINLKDFIGYECLLYYHEERLIGANIFKTYQDVTGKAFVSYQFLWDYENPKLSLGSVSQYYECKLAHFLRCEHVYLLGGYESASAYKADFKGFEFWTGKEWSKDTTLYTKLCQRDNHAHIRTP
jgi:arginyl-tRNA--protein-N-Asp/Glu arginylyltransferase